MSPQVSFIVPIYKVASYIEECVRSLYEQTLDDIEIILIDDCSPDNSINIAMEVLKEYPQRKDQVRVIRHSQNQGIASVRHVGYEACRGEYFIYVDGDDFVDVHMAEEMYQNAKINSADMVICDFYRYGKNTCRQDTLVPNGVEGEGDNVRTDIMNRKVPAFLWCKAVKRAVLNDKDVVWPTGDFAEDTVISVVEAYFSKRITHVAKPLYYYRRNPNSLSHEVDEHKIVQHYERSLVIVNQTIQFFENHNLDQKYERGIFVNKVRTKNRLLPLTNKMKYRRLWWRTYPEINKIIFWGNKCNPSSYREKIWMCVVMMGLYPKFKRRLHSKKFLPYKEWL